VSTALPPLFGSLSPTAAGGRPRPRVVKDQPDKDMIGQLT
jgi:hypothetical protein